VVPWRIMARARGTSPASSHPVDGRRARTARTRAAILDAVLALIRAGAIHPTAADIAAQAKVSLRSIAQHFPTRVALFASAAERHGARPEVTLPDPAMPLARRLRAFAAARATDLEATRLLRASAAQFVADYPVVAAAIVGNAATRRAPARADLPARAVGAGRRRPRAPRRRPVRSDVGRAARARQLAGAVAGVDDPVGPASPRRCPNRARFVIAATVVGRRRAGASG
jgi:TetR/AcrR family transcriptional regulator of autoinduction and epiphytic fitness